MNEAEQLRRAMRTTEVTSQGVLDLAAVMRDGRQLRQRRRLAGAGAAALATAVIAGVALGVQVAHPPGPELTPAPAATTTTTRPAATASPSESTPQPRPVGAVVASGIWYGSEERVFYVVPVEVPRQPHVTIGLVAGRRAADGRLTSDFVVNDTEGNDRRPGFHQIGYDQPGPIRTSPAVPTFGYFVGPAKRIVGTAAGREVEARLVRWSRDGQVVIFWFDPAQLRPGTSLDGIAAVDAHGRTL
ncbi:hypothetical protein [Micromonospora auratinigra]|uniref:Uncharacterized protein n=1 Tax=Micromonospora auratinigra TaxID=261654 RepID=A0A1A8Z4H1_9ACTN|nr:hypothetical protein [Micromonospora auratinigra]SBT38678.1 hypothetical protein GA0070611_0636 [Micromonospora auratinigra]